MSLKTSLRRNRNGERNIIVPNRLDTIEFMQPRERVRKVIGDLDSQVMNAFFNPPNRGKFYKHYIRMPTLYNNEVIDMSLRGRQSVFAYLINHHLCGKLAYMLEHPNMYGEFKDFKRAWVSNALYAMRNTILKQMYLRGEIGTTRSNSINAIIALPYHKPLDYYSGGLLADKLFDICYERSMYLLSIR